ncbi:MAG TPA: YceI family protein [Candidatus Acidoferrales bacterium]|nr:YceI family protein [Candidatus Acidoferrales bacterium]
MGTQVMDAGTKRGRVPVKFVIDATASRFTVQAFAAGLLSSFGHNPTMSIRDFSGEIECQPETFDQANIRFTVRTSAMEVLDEMKRDDRRKLEQEMYGTVLEVSRFPEAEFESKSISVQKLSADLLAVHVTGDLTFHGATQSHAFDARVTRLGTMLRISGDFPLSQSEYGIKPFSAAGGTLRLKDEVKFSFELVARQQE